jgi:putative PIN family toxin of toxin-antitoxin system
MTVVFDTNVVVSACLWRGAPFDCLAAWARGGFRAAVSPPLLIEYEETLDELRLDYPQRAVVDWGSALRDAADLVFPVDRATGAVTDPFDEMVLECALAASARFIVSGDKKHLLPLGSFRDIPVLPPADFLRRLPAS